ncbi:MAG: N-acetylmuramoyl-L-alanine amidase [Candidatus Omnitrophica bacterium]|nr:N-acetylmuramoyl-L-alanine amidase [Candidatus Omnitrophota bacterium]
MVSLIKIGEWKVESGKWKKQRNFRFTLRFLSFVLSTIHFPLSIFLFSGCVPSNRSVLTETPTALVGFDPVNYVSLISYCESREIPWEWDPVVNVVTLEGKSAKGKFLLDSRIGMVGGERVYLSEPLRGKNGLIFFPKGSMPLLESLNVSRGPPPAEGVFQIRKIVIDPGHGGKDPGARGRLGSKEKDIVLDVALRLRDLLVKEGIEIVMTRDKDQFVSLGRRAQIANENKSDFFLSVHANSSKSRSASGFEIYYLSDAVDDEARAVAAMENAVLDLEEESFSERNQTLEATLWDIMNNENRAESEELAREICKAAQTRLGIRNRGTKSARFAVLKSTTMPAVLIETGFLSNSLEEQKLQSASYRQRLAEAIAGGILVYKEHYEKREGFTN